MNLKQMFWLITSRNAWDILHPFEIFSRAVISDTALYRWIRRPARDMIFHWAICYIKKDLYIIRMPPWMSEKP